MGHVGEKFALGAAGGFGGQFGPFQFFFGPSAFGDIRGDSEHVISVAIRRNQRSLDRLKPERLTEAGRPLLFAHNLLLERIDHFPILALQFFNLPGVRIEVRFQSADHLLHRSTVESGDGAVDQDEASFAIFD